tara:strand:- start:616 stop:780 length:165 start_codon:yes stop_codon:yes gene_type:complete
MNRKNFVFIADTIIESNISSDDKVKLAELFKHKLSVEYSNFKGDVFINYIKGKI